MPVRAVHFATNRITRWVTRRYVNEAPPVRLTQRRIYILPTKAGLLFGSTLILMLLGSVNYNLSLGFVLVFLLAGLGIASMLHTYRELAGLVMRPGKSDAAFAGNRGMIRLLVNNDSKHARYGVEFHPHSLSHARVDLPDNTEWMVEVSVPTSHRGILHFDRWKITSTFPLGVFRAWGYAHLVHEVLVYPAPEASGPPPPDFLENASEGMAITQGHEDFSGLRRYEQGDSPRQVAWKALAHGHPMMSKQFTGGAQAELHLRWQDTPPALGTEGRLSRLCRWLLEASSAGHPYSLELPATQIANGLGVAHDAVCLRALALHHAHE